MTGHTPAEQGRHIASGDWLLSAAPVRLEAIAQWRDAGSAWLVPGILFAAVTIAAGRVHEAAGVGRHGNGRVLLPEVLDGPVFHQERVFGRQAAYTVLLPGSAARRWRVPGTVVHPPAAQLLVPAPDRVQPVTDGPWWVVPFEGPGLLCTPAVLAGFLSGAHTPGGEGA
ncbi:hypothetical protein V2S66_17140 [Streptomyces sp. V4-01]|uniref:Uncharacterized protein n=1 Tax=Actinacidiphila polyblastidii TaxID=3110430 RepID=A0ABU7PCZ2_9ACTN|nr:hypothetical protein [Streptomyces sp. V4-01]